MDAKTLLRQMQDYALWKQQLSTCLGEFQTWFSAYRIGSPEIIVNLKQVLEGLHDTHYTLALTGEFGRGKTELINALLVSDYRQRLLPIGPGGSTQCTTEIFFDSDHPGQYLQLLPIETYRTQRSLSDFRRIPQHWISVNLDSRDPASVAQALSMLGETKTVSAEQARELGFDPQQLPLAEPGLLQIPAWRHALLSIDLPLLRLGLRLIDAPGANSLHPHTGPGALLEQSHALLYVLGADSGIGQRERQLWRDELQPLAARCAIPLLTVINKIDTLRDEPDCEQAPDQRLHRLRARIATQLEQAPARVLPLSARQALVARQRQNPQTLLQSQWSALDTTLATCQEEFQSRQQHSGPLLAVVELMHSTHQLLLQAQRSATHEADALTAATAAEQHRHNLDTLREQIRAEQTAYDHQALRLRTQQKAIARQQQALLRQTSALQLEDWLADLLSQTHEGCNGKTVRTGLDHFFAELGQQQVQLRLNADQACAEVQHIYAQNGLEGAIPALDFSAGQRELEQLQAQAAAVTWRLGPLTLVRRQPLALLLQTLAGSCRERNQRQTEHIHQWLRDALAPVAAQTQEQKQRLDQQLLRLSEYQLTYHDQCERLQLVNSNIARNQQALAELDLMLEQIRTILPGTADIPTLTEAADSAATAPLPEPVLSAEPRQATEPRRTTESRQIPAPAAPPLLDHPLSAAPAAAMLFQLAAEPEPAASADFADADLDFDDDGPTAADSPDDRDEAMDSADDSDGADAPYQTDAPDDHLPPYRAANRPPAHTPPHRDDRGRAEIPILTDRDIADLAADDSLFADLEQDLDIPFHTGPRPGTP